MEKIKKSRIEYIDLLEASAILFVVLYHTRDYTYNFLEGEKGLLLYVPYFFRAVLSTCVPLFFFANGFLLLNKKFDLKNRARFAKRFRRRRISTTRRGAAVRPLISFPALFFRAGSALQMRRPAWSPPSRGVVRRGFHGRDASADNVGAGASSGLESSVLRPIRPGEREVLAFKKKFKKFY